MAAKRKIVRAGIRLVCEYLSNQVRNEKRRKPRRWWVREWILRRRNEGASVKLLPELAADDLDMYRNHLRMSEEKFEELLQKVTRTIQKQDTVLRKALPARLKLQVVLRYLATGDCFATLSVIYRVPKNSISQFLPDICKAICDGLQDFIKVPSTEEEWNDIAHEFYIKWNFPNCCGAIDGKHCTIRKPPHTGSEYYNYKHSFSIILFALVDANYCFTYIDVGTNGRVNDARVFSKSSLYEAIEGNLLNLPPNGVFVGDDAFPLRTNLLKPYPRSTPLSLQQRVFNYRLSRARRIVENAFGIMASRFRVYEKPIPLKVETTEMIIKATCALHNWLRKTSSRTYFPSGCVDREDVENGTIIKADWRHNMFQGLLELPNAGSNNYTKNAGRLRDLYAEKFTTTEAVPWQWNMI